MSASSHFLETADGGAFPSVGLGTWKIPSDVLPALIPAAVEIGYRHFDCACDSVPRTGFVEALRQPAGACEEVEYLDRRFVRAHT